MHRERQQRSYHDNYAEAELEELYERNHREEESYYDSFNDTHGGYYEEEAYAEPGRSVPLYAEPVYRQPQRQRVQPHQCGPKVRRD